MFAEEMLGNYSKRMNQHTCWQHRHVKGQELFNPLADFLLNLVSRPCNCTAPLNFQFVTFYKST
jgi:hypothetical protein